jgi:hypothetical protein
MITTENWTYACYRNEELRALIHCGAEPGPGDGLEFIYFANILDALHQPVSQKVFLDLEKAVEYLNTHYQLWSFESESKIDPTGCSSCQAH